MVEQVTFQTIFQFLQTVGILVGVLYYIMTIRSNQRNQKIQLENRQTQLFMQFTNKLADLRVDGTWNEIFDEWSWNDCDDFMNKYGPEANPGEWEKFMAIAGIFERMGVLAAHESVDVQLIYDFIAGNPIRLWDKYEKIIDYVRIEIEDPPKGMFLENFEDLVFMLRDVRAEDIRDLEHRLKRRRVRRQALGRTMPDYP
jgi:hypothetical protein